MSSARVLIVIYLLALGCKVIATASTEDKRRICKEEGGADYTIDYTQTGWQVSPCA